jgi:DNA topoisomerase II
VTRAVFHPDDDAVLTYLDDDGLSIEPQHYVPVLPLVLVNGADGIGTGWSSGVPNYSPRDVIENLRRLVRGEPMVDMQPWYRCAGTDKAVPQLGIYIHALRTRIALNCVCR